MNKRSVNMLELFERVQASRMGCFSQNACAYGVVRPLEMSMTTRRQSITNAV